MLQDWELAAPADDGALVGLLSRWATRGRQESPEPQVNIQFTKRFGIKDWARHPVYPITSPLKGLVDLCNPRS